MPRNLLSLDPQDMIPRINPQEQHLMHRLRKQTVAATLVVDQGGGGDLDWLFDIPNTLKARE